MCCFPLPRPAVRSFRQAAASLLLSALSLPLLQAGDPPASPVPQPSPAARFQVINSGVSGNTTKAILKRLDADVLSQKPRLVVLMAGTNDMLNSQLGVTYDEYRARLEEIVASIQKTGSKVILMTIPPCIESCVYTRHPKETFGAETPMDRVRKANEIVRDVAAKSSCDVVDVFQAITDAGVDETKPESVLRNGVNSSKQDGVHPTEKGAEVIEKAVLKAVRASGIDSGTVICLGDSITRGAGIKGSGTTDGQTYPALLSRDLNAGS